MTLPYEEGRLQIKTGDLIFIRNKGLFHHRLITWFTRSQHIHVGIAFWTSIEGEEHLMISEANGGAQRRIVNLSQYKDHDMDVLESMRPWDEIRSQVLERLGQVQYSWIEAGYVGFSERIKHSLGISLPMIDFPGEICSEFVANIMEVPQNYLSPAELFRHLHEEKDIPIRVCIRH